MFLFSSKVKQMAFLQSLVIKVKLSNSTSRDMKYKLNPAELLPWLGHPLTANDFGSKNLAGTNKSFKYEKKN